MTIRGLWSSDKPYVRQPRPLGDRRAGQALSAHQRRACARSDEAAPPVTVAFLMAIKRSLDHGSGSVFLACFVAATFVLPIGCGSANQSPSSTGMTLSLSGITVGSGTRSRDECLHTPKVRWLNVEPTAQPWDEKRRRKAWPKCGTLIWLSGALLANCPLVRSLPEPLLVHPRTVDRRSVSARSQ